MQLLNNIFRFTWIDFSRSQRKKNGKSFYLLWWKIKNKKLCDVSNETKSKWQMNDLLYLLNAIGKVMTNCLSPVTTIKNYNDVISSKQNTKYAHTFTTTKTTHTNTHTSFKQNPPINYMIWLKPKSLFVGKADKKNTELYSLSIDFSHDDWTLYPFIV